eukprot:tig00020710_g13321.t1
MIHQFFVLNKEGQLIHVRTYSGLELDRSLLTGFFSSIGSFTASLADQTLRTLVLDRSKFTYIEAGDYVLVAHGAADDADAIVRLQLSSILQMLTFLVGDPQQWSPDTLTLDGLDDVIDQIVERFNHDIAAVAQGFPKVALDKGASDQLERLLASLEAHGDVQGAALLLGRSVLHSRLTVPDTRAVLAYATARPLGVAAARTTPVFSEGRWRHLILYRLRTASIALITGVQARPARPPARPLGRSLYLGLGFQALREIFVPALPARPTRPPARPPRLARPPARPTARPPAPLPAPVLYDALAPHLAAFERHVADAGLSLPIEEPPVQLRQFASREVVAFVYGNARSGQRALILSGPYPTARRIPKRAVPLVVPQMRPAPPVEQQRTADAFRWFTNRALMLLQDDVRDVFLYREGYRFHAHREGPHLLYVLCTDQVRAGDLEGMTSEIQRTCALRSS